VRFGCENDDSIPISQSSSDEAGEALHERRIVRVTFDFVVIFCCASVGMIASLLILRVTEGGTSQIGADKPLTLENSFDRRQQVARGIGL
jgi:hypothetical protein